MSEAPKLTNLVPGFDFLQSLVKTAGAAMPSIGQWVAPTLDPDELGKRIDELRTVQFWLEQNARMLGATIQALEVQRMTLSTLQTMNVQMDDLRESMKIKLPVLDEQDEDEAEEPPKPRVSPFASRSTRSETASADEADADEDETAGAADGATAAGVVDPMQWWGALTKQFTELATTAMREAASKPIVPGLVPAGPSDAPPEAAAGRRSTASERKSPASKSAAPAPAAKAATPSRGKSGSRQSRPS